MSTGARNIYSPIRGGFVQNTYADQMESAYVGQLANASDYNLVDSYITGAVGADGLVAGVGVIANIVTDPTRPGINELSVEYPATGTTAADFEAVTVRNEQMSTNSSGMPCMFEGEMINGLRNSRVGGRIWVMLSNGTSASQTNAHWIISDTTSHGHQVGSFSAVAITGDTVELTFMKFRGIFSAPADGFSPALVEIVTA